MKTILKCRWPIFALWVIVTVALSVFQPDINSILERRGQNPLSPDSPSVVADGLLQKMETTTGTDNIIVFYNENKITDEEMDRIGAAVDKIASSSVELGIGNLVDPFHTPEAKSSLVSSDGTTLMVSFKLDKGEREIAQIRSQFDEKLAGVGVAYYLTGTDFINQDYLDASVSGVEKSAILTVLFILVVLVIMFRSVVTPMVSLLAVAFSYFTSMGIVAQLIDKAGFPVTTLTQVLLILILFGIGTDYNILLFNRFKEELSQGSPVDEAIAKTYRTAGKTIAFSVLTVLIAFFGLIFSESPIFRSGIAVVIGAAVLLLEIVTLTPMAMKVLGSRIFWPSKQTGGHKESGLWGRISAASTKRPILCTAIVVLLVGASVAFYQPKLSFDTIGELSDAYPSAKGFHLVADHFGKGEAMPSTLVIKNNGPMDNNEALSALDSLTQSIQQIDGVKQVASVTRPQGQPIDEFYISGQMSSVTDGMASMQGGLDQISDGLSEAQEKLGSADFSKAGELVDGTAQMHDAVSALADGLSQLQAGLTGKQSSATIESGLTKIESNLSNMSGGIKTLASNYTAMRTGFDKMGKQYQDVAQALLGIKAALTQMQGMVGALGTSYADAQTDPNYLGLKTTVDGLVSSLGQVTPQGIDTLNQNYNAMTAGFGTSIKNLRLMGDGLAQMASGLNKTKSGLTKASDGIGTIVTNMKTVATGLDEMKAGQQLLVSNLGQLSAFGGNMAQVTGALKDISDGLGQSRDFLAQLGRDRIFHIPDEALESADYKASLDAFMSADRTVTKMIIVLDDDPYSQAAVRTVQEINAAVSGGLGGTALSGAEFGLAGQSASTNDMNNGLSRDLNKMMAIVLAGVFLVLLVVTRSFWTPVIITLSLVGTYYAAMFVTNSIFIHALNHAGVASFVPFFSFLIIVALGVDYSIFLMMRFREYGGLTPRDAIVTASRQIGGVVISAVVILGGTFATLIPSGMLLLIELAVAVIVGLVVLCFVMLPVFLPATISLVNRFKK